ncbi:MAG: aldo/keto reductase [bacterium]|nr:aldo/keto reductase [bacterium]
MRIATHATPEGTAAYRDRMSDRLPAEHFSETGGLLASSIGLGTYLGPPTDEGDEAYYEAIRRALLMGCNVIDTAVNYRHQRSERIIGRVLADAVAAGEVAREEVLVCTKGGFIAFDGSQPSNPPAWFEETFLSPGICTPQDVVAGCHVMTPRYMRHQLEVSLTNLGLECVDVYYLHNPETQLEEVGHQEFNRRVADVFEALEETVSEGKVRWYGMATWTGFRVDPEAPGHLSLSDMVDIARGIAGEDHHFRAIQLPYNLNMTEAFLEPTQAVGRNDVSPLRAARAYGLATFASASLMQAQLARDLPPRIAEAFDGLATDAQRAIQYVRSTPDLDVALVGMSSVAHVEENLALAAVPPAAPDHFRTLFDRMDDAESGIEA